MFQKLLNFHFLNFYIRIQIFIIIIIIIPIFITVVRIIYLIDINLPLFQTFQIMNISLRFVTDFT